MDGLLGMEAEAALKHIAIRIATKWKQPYLRNYGYIKSRLAITLVHVTHCCILGYQLLVHKISVHQFK